MDRKLLTALEKSLESILAMDENELLEGFGRPENEHFFSALTRIENCFFETPRTFNVDTKSDSVSALLSDDMNGVSYSDKCGEKTLFLEGNFDSVLLTNEVYEWAKAA